MTTGVRNRTRVGKTPLPPPEVCARARALAFSTRVAACRRFELRTRGHRVRTNGQQRAARTSERERLAHARRSQVAVVVAQTTTVAAAAAVNRSAACL